MNSKRFAVYLLLVMVVLLFVSTFFPSEFTLTEREWMEFAQRNPTGHWLATRLATPGLVKNPVFMLLSLFLFSSTLACTVQRVRTWLRLRKSEFEKEKAFSFTREAVSEEEAGTLREGLANSLSEKGWEVQSEGDMLSAQKGFRLGFWGSVVFHAGLLVCLIAVPVTGLTVFRGELVLTEGTTVPLNEEVVGFDGADASALPATPITVYDLRGEYAEGKYKVDFGGRMRLGEWDVPFWVNKPVDYRGYQIGIYEFGNSPGVEIEKGGRTIFDYFLNLRSPAEGDYFDMPGEELQLFVLFFPDFKREGTVLKTMSKEPNNPVLLVKFLKDGAPLHRGLLIRPGEDEVFGEYTVRFTELRNWVNLIVVRELGVPIIALGFLIGIPGLFVRFLSNERRIEFTFAGEGEETRITLRGYSRYYPAFLEREISRMAEHLVYGMRGRTHGVS
jgi:cytochrome c biogenesis protein